MPLIISTLSSDTDYTFYKTIVDGKNIRHNPVMTITIKGGQGVMRRRELVTPESGVVTEVTAEQCRDLLSHPVFKRHSLRGFVRIVDTDVVKKAEKEISTMQSDDDGAQLTPYDFAPDAAAAVESGNDELKINGKKVAPGKKRSTKRK